MNTKQELEDLNKKIAGKTMEISEILDSLISSSAACNSNCRILLEIADNKNTKILKHILKSNELLKH